MWEYMSFKLDTAGAVCGFDKNLERQSFTGAVTLTGFLDAAGAEGWELVEIDFANKIGVMKRRIVGIGY